MKKNLTIEEADALFEKYYNGETIGMEEVLLHDFLQQKDLPERFEAERALFGYFEVEKQQLTVSDDEKFVIETAQLSDEQDIKQIAPSRNLWLRLNPVLKWSLAAAVLFSAVLIFDNLIQKQNSNIAYVNGILCTDSREVATLAIASIDQLDLESDEVAGAVDKINDNDMVESQLQQFVEVQ